MLGGVFDAGGPGSGRRPGSERARYLRDQLKRSDKSLIERPRKSITDRSIGSLPVGTEFNPKTGKIKYPTF